VCANLGLYVTAQMYASVDQLLIFAAGDRLTNCDYISAALIIAYTAYRSLSG